MIIAGAQSIPCRIKVREAGWVPTARSTGLTASPLVGWLTCHWLPSLASVNTPAENMPNSRTSPFTVRSDYSQWHESETETGQPLAWAISESFIGHILSCPWPSLAAPRLRTRTAHGLLACLPGCRAPYKWAKLWADPFPFPAMVEPLSRLGPKIATVGLACGFLAQGRQWRRGEKHEASDAQFPRHGSFMRIRRSWGQSPFSHRKRPARK
jgi:hypothetical protein